MTDCLNTIYELKDERKYLRHYKKFSQIRHFEILFGKIVEDIRVFKILNSNKCLYVIDLNEH